MEIIIAADEYVDMNKGTGAVKVTPAHDPNDFEIGERHSAKIRITDDEGVLDNAGKYKGMDRYDGRRAGEDPKAGPLVRPRTFPTA